jgi:diguanylate cyclase (GGDEF)-like protein
MSISVKDLRLSVLSEPKTRVDVWYSDPFLKELYLPLFNQYPIECHWELSPKNWKLLLRKLKPHYLILDLGVVSENPIQSLHEMKSISPGTEIIVLSHTDDVHIAISAFKAGISDYYLKPTNPETLWYALQKLISTKNLLPHDPTLQADLEMFSVTHHINIAESDHKMRELAINHLIHQTGAGGAIWLCPSSNTPRSSSSLTQTIDGTAFFVEYWGCHSSQEAQEELTSFQNKFPLLMRDSFFTHLTSHPEHWFRGDCAWIPLKNSSMGGILLFGLSGVPSELLKTRTEFLIRSLEVSLENHQRYIEAKQLTYIDDLTGLYNPRFLEQALNIAMDSLNKKNQGFCVLFIDIDKFKQVNDQYGHLVGSQMLTHIGKLIKSSLRKNDQVFRYGGDEFIAILYETELSTAKEIAERVRKSAEARTFRFPMAHIKITLSIGIARFPDHGNNKETVISMADTAMYASKKSGRNQVIVAQPEIHG